MYSCRYSMDELNTLRGPTEESSYRDEKNTARFFGKSPSQFKMTMSFTHMKSSKLENSQRFTEVTDGIQLVDY